MAMSAVVRALRSDAVRQEFREQMRWAVAATAGELLRSHADEEAHPYVARRLREIAAAIDERGLVGSEETT